MFLDAFPRNTPTGCDFACMAANVDAHEIGHTLGFDAPGHAWGFLGLGGSVESAGERIWELRGEHLTSWRADEEYR